MDNRFIATLLAFLLIPGAARAAEVGETTGTVTVTPTGASSYSIPIVVPPGIGGLQPQLALTYSSQAGQGLLGAGFSLGGLSLITRCPAALEPDGFIDPVDLDDNDRYCLDGQRLVVTSGAYGAPNAEYRTEIESFSKVESLGSVAHDPQSFRVWTKGGLVMEYGNTMDSRWDTGYLGKGVAWALNRVTDRAGNYLAVTYSENPYEGDAVPVAVDYTGNAGASLAPTLRVTFEYEERPDPSQRYFGGAPQTLSRRLTHVRTYIDGGATLVRDYRIAYAPGAPTRAVSVTECAASACLPPTTLGWPSTGTGWLASQSQGGVHGDGGKGIWFVDISGDGLADYVTKTNDDGIHWNLATPTGWGPSRSQGGMHGAANTGSWLVDLNGDGKADYVTKDSSGILGWNLSTGDGWAAGQTQAGVHGGGTEGTWFVDINGDGRADHVTKNADYSLHWNLWTGNGWGPNQSQSGLHGIGSRGIWFADINGDGMADYITKSNDSAIHWNLSTGTGWAAPRSQGDVHGDGGRGMWFADVNGDGMADYVTKTNDQNIHWNLSKGDGWAPSRTQGGMHGDGGSGTWVVDINGDGMADYVTKIADGSLHWNLASGSGWGPAQSQGGLHGNGSLGTWFADINGDGMADHVTRSNDTAIHWNASAHRPMQLESIARATGAITRFEYRPLSDASVHTPSTGSAYPVADVRGAYRVVAASEASNGIGGMNRMTYRYTGARLHLRGRGWLGFSQIRSDDLAAGIQASTTLRQDFPYIGLADYDKRETATGFVIADTSTTWAAKTLGPSVFVYAQKVTGRTWELNTQQRVTTTITDNTYGDDYGNLTSRFDRVYAGVSTGGSPFETLVTNTFAAPDVAQWRTGQLVRSTVNRDSPGLSSITRTVAFEYAPATGLLAAEIVEPDDPALRVRTAHGRDALGNVVSTTISGDTFSARSTTWEFDRAAPYFGRFATRSTNALLHSEQRAFDPATGNVVRSTGPNGLVTTYSHDAWGRPAGESFNQHGIARWSQLQRRWCADAPGTCKPGEIFFIQATQADGGGGSEFFDVLARPVRAARKVGSGAWVESRTEYDALGRVSRTSSPHFSNAAPQFWSTRTYDAVGRRIQVTAPASQNAPAGCVSRITYAGLVLTAYDCANRPTTRETDPLGRLVRVTDALGSSTLYTYDPFDNLTSTTSPDNAATTLKYDRRGRKSEMTEPNMGRWTYTHNGLGELISQKSARGKVVNMTYDLLGRMVQRSHADEVATWTWDTAWKGALTQVSDDDYRRTLSYHPHGAVASEEVVVFTRSPRVTQFTYDALGRPAQTTYHTGLAIENRFNAHGALACVAKVGSSCYWEARDWDVWGSISASRLGNGVETFRSRDPAVGTLDALFAGRNGGSEVQSLNYAWDASGNLRSRTDQNQGGLSEAFQYDALDRLTGSTLAGSQNLSAGYSASGNLLAKAGVAYAYGTRPHAVTQAGSATIAYDADGNMTTGGGASGSRVISWTPYGQPWRIDDGTSFVQFHYNPDGRRVYQSASSAQLGTRTIHYFSALHEEHKAGSTTHQKHYIPTPEGIAAVETWNGSTFVKLEYLHRDHLNSLDVVTNAAGQVVERLSFDAFGRRRGANWQGGAATSFATSRGFTGHEMLDDVGLIHMNGRIYDPALGRFVSADPIVSEAASTQGHNRYAYVGNNPGSYTDPSGFSKWHSVWKRIEKIHRYSSPSQHFAEGRIHYMQKSEKYQAFTDVASIVGTYYLGPYIAGAHTAFMSYSQGASLKDALHAGGIACGAGYALSYVNSNAFISDYGYTTSTVASGIIGGAVSYRSGGQFSDGFWRALGFAALSNSNRYMRAEVGKQSALNEDGLNDNGKSRGLFGDGKKYAGARRAYDPLTGEPLKCTSPAGGCQGAPLLPGDERSNFLGMMEYSPNTVPDWINESFAGPHDFLRNLTGAYDAAGNAIVYRGAMGVLQEWVLNAGLIVPAAPFAGAAMVMGTYYSGWGN